MRRSLLRRSCAALLEPIIPAAQKISPSFQPQNAGTTSPGFGPTALLLDLVSVFLVARLYEVGTNFLTTSRAVSRPKASFPYSRKMIESLVIFSTLPLNTWSFSRRKYVFFVLFATTAIIFPVVSFTVPCKTSSGIARQRFPLVQFGSGPFTLRARIGLTNGSLRPRAPHARVTGLGFSSAFATGPACVTLGAGTGAADFGCALVAVLLLVVFLAVVLFVGVLCTGLTAITAGASAEHTDQK